MAGVKVGNNTYLRSLNCSNSYLLGTATDSQTLDLSNCKNLKTVDISYTKFTGITFPRDTVLNSINLTGSSVKNISIDGAEFLDEIKITGCDNINKFELNRCNRITSINVANSTIQNFIATNCNKVIDVDLSGCKSIASFDVTNSYNIETLNMRANSSSVMQDLKLYSMYNLKKLIVSQTSTAHTIRLPKYLNQNEANKAAIGEPAKLWDNLEYLDISDSTLMKIQYGSADVDDEVVDMKQLTKLKTLSFSNASYLTEIRDLTFTGSLTNLFYGCKKLNKITGTISNTNNNINSMFAYCYELQNIDNLTMNLVGIISAASTCDRCFRMKTPMLKKILHACGSTLTNISYMCHMAGMDGYTAILGTAEDTTRTIPSDLFIRNTNLQNAGGAFDITNYTTIPGDLFDPCAETINNLSATFARMGSLETVGPALLHNKPNLATVSNLFACDGKLTHYIDEFPNIFLGSSNITSTQSMFYGCSELMTGEDGLGEMMYPLVNLTNCAYMFYGCTNNLNCEIPDGLLSRNRNLVKMNGMFQRCSKLPKLPRSLFRVNIGDTNELLNLTKAVGVFGGCKAMEGEVDSTFFVGAPNLVNIGRNPEDNMVYSVSRYPSEGFFEGTKITGYHETFLNPVPKLQDVSGLFSKCSNLVECYYYKGSEVMTRGNSISEDLFMNNRLITDMSYMFGECSKIEGHIPEGLFDFSRNLLQNVSCMFYGCSALSGINLDAKENDKVQTGVCDQWFKNAPSLTNMSSFMNGCVSYIGTIPEELLYGCTALQNTSGLFANCKLLTGGIPLKLFNDCRGTITNTSSMFQGCEELNEEFPVGEYSTEQGVIAYKLATDANVEGALQVVATMTDPLKQITYSDVVNLSPNLATIINASGNYYVTREIGDVVKVEELGLLAECVNLTTIANMFNGCKKIPGGIPHDLLFTSKQAVKYTKLTSVAGLFKNCEAINKPYIEEETNITYICDPVLFEKCTAITDCSSVFNRMYGFNNVSGCQIHPKMFDKQTKVTTVYELFMGTKVTGPVSMLFSNSVNSITDARKMFAFSNITSVANNFLSGGGINKKLQMVQGIFYGCSNIEGTSPEFWNGAKFTALMETTAGRGGALHTCTKLSNYAQAEAKHAEWVASQAIYL
jgi:hypothetical protein